MNDDDRKLSDGQSGARVPACARPSQLRETKYVVRVLSTEGLTYRHQRFHHREVVTELLSELEKLKGARKRITGGILVEAKFRVDGMPDGTKIEDLSETSIFCPTIGEDVVLPNVSGGQWREKSKK